MLTPSQHAIVQQIYLQIANGQMEPQVFHAPYVIKDIFPMQNKLLLAHQQSEYQPHAYMQQMEFVVNANMDIYQITQQSHNASIQQD